VEHAKRFWRRISALLVGGCVAATLSGAQTSARQTQPALALAHSTAAPSPRAVIDKYCITCHNQKLRTAGLELESLNLTAPGPNAEVWEKVIAKLRAGSMPPPGRPRPDGATYRAVASSLEREIDRAWEASPDPGRIAAVHRLNRAEYNNAIRDLLALDLDVKPLLPGDETADGSFDNFADALSISTAHLERYLSVARQVTRLATGLPPASPGLERFEIPLFVMQDDRQSEDLPLGSRGGIAIRHDFQVNGEYLIKVRLQRQYQDYLKGMGWPQQLDLRLDGGLLKRFTVGGKAEGRPAAASYAGDGEPGFAGDDSWEKYMQVGGDAGLEIRVPVDAGPHIVGVSFVRELWEPEGLPQPLQRGRVIANDQVYMDYANVASVQIGGPYTRSGPALDTPSRRAILVCQPSSGVKEPPGVSSERSGAGLGAPGKRSEPSGAEGPPRLKNDRSCAIRILSRMARLAYRRPVTNQDVQTLLEFFDTGRHDADSFDAGIQFALERMLVDPDFLLRVYRDPKQSAVGSRPASVPAVHRLSDLEVASRLSFFLWSSIPDDRLLALAEGGQLTSPSILEKEVRRMLADPRAIDALVGNFAAQWLNLRRVEEVVVDPERYPNYDLSLLQAFQRETELFVGSTIREDRSVGDLLNANYTFVNERLARHYGIPGIYGSRFRRVMLPNRDQRGGLLAEGALLATTSYPDRTSPVLRGKWLLNNIFGLPVPPPPPGVDTNLENKPGAAPRSMRERLAQHRQNPSCSSCHSVIDPLGFALENFDVIGGWRTVDESGKPVDASGATVSGEKVEGLSGLRALLLAQPEQFPRTVTEKLLAYALGRPLDFSDRPAVRKIVRDAAAHDYRWSSLILGIVESPTFLMRASQTASN
jgi:mono/diheme cytochrome c family protein